MAALLVMALCLTVWILTPDRLTPIAERLANENLNADVKIKRMELTVWKTFPYMTIDVDGLNVRSRTLDKHKASLPAGVDSLLDVGCMRARFNLARLALMDVEIKEILVDSPKVNLSGGQRAPQQLPCHLKQGKERARQSSKSLVA